MNLLAALVAEAHARLWGATGLVEIERLADLPLAEGRDYDLMESWLEVGDYLGEVASAIGTALVPAFERMAQVIPAWLAGWQIAGQEVAHE